MQAFAGAWLIRRFVGFPTTLSKELDIFRFMIFAGPVACLLNATFGASALYATGVVASSAVSFSWFTWWIGDTIGVLITAPMMLIAFAQPRQLWWGRRTAVAIPLLLALSSMIVVFVWASKVEQERVQFEFKEIATNTHEKLHASFNSYLDSVAYIERHLSSSTEVSRGEFKTFIEFALQTKPGIHALSWNPLVLNQQRDKLEQRVLAEGFSHFQITERNNSKQLVRAGDRSDYVPVLYIEPMQSNESALGFDVASNTERQRALIHARDSGESIATAKITLVQAGGEQAGFLLFRPVYSGSPVTLDQRRQAIRGYAVGIFRVAGIVDAMLDNLPKKDVVVSIYDVSDAQPDHLYGPTDISTVNTIEYSLDIGQRRWLVQFRPSPTYLTKYRSWQAWGLLVGGLLFTSLLGAFMLAMTGRSYQVENLVARRTAELRGILTTAIEAIITMDANGNIETMNPAGENLFGYQAAELTGVSIAKIIPDFFSEGEVTPQTAPLPTGAGARRDSFALKADQSKVPIELAISSVVIAERVLYTAIIHDLTERRNVERMKDEFVSTISHELRTPLTSIKGALGLIVAGALDSQPEKAKDMLRISFENCGRLGHLIDDLLDFEKVQLSQFSLTLQPLSINALIDKTVCANQGYAAKYGVFFGWKMPDIDVVVNGDENKLIQILSNLLSNAVKYSPKGASVTITTEILQNNIRVLIADVGSGIPLEFQ
ncbi:MAG: CHASE domain-containing protein, partial [Gammaproteobacteria bacterium]|nr:CHASE domain-containing protein [Gammaproteobacteria bacterium]